LWGSPVTFLVQVPRFIVSFLRGANMNNENTDLDQELLTLLAEASETALHQFLHIMKSEAVRIGLDLPGHPARPESRASSICVSVDSAIALFSLSCNVDFMQPTVFLSGSSSK